MCEVKPFCHFDVHHANVGLGSCWASPCSAACAEAELGPALEARPLSRRLASLPKAGRPQVLTASQH